MHTTDHILSDKLLHQFAERAAVYDRENRFFHEDFNDLRRAGYLTMPVPRELGGAGMTLAEVCREQRRLAYYAPATALGINMHLYWVGVAADLWRQGDHSLEWMLNEAIEGEVFNAGHSERGNDLPVLLSTSKAERIKGGFPLHWAQDVWQPDAGMDAHGAARHLGGCRGWAEGRARLSAARLRRLAHGRDLGHDGHARHAQRRHRARRRVCPGQIHCAHSARRRRRQLCCRNVRLGADGLREHLLWRRAAGDGPRPAGTQEQDLGRT